MICLIGGEKGGSGKSCLAQNIAVALQQRNHDVLLVDADPQLTTAVWAKERSKNENLPHIPCVQLHNAVENIEGIAATDDVRRTLKDLEKRYQTIVIDAGGQDSEALRAAMTVASHMLVPLRPKRRDLKTLPKMKKLVSMATSVNDQLKARSVITQCSSLPTQNYRVLDAKEICLSFEVPSLNAITYMRNAYDDSDEAGCGVHEGPTKVDKKAVNEIEAITNELLEMQ